MEGKLQNMAQGGEQHNAIAVHHHRTLQQASSHTQVQAIRKTIRRRIEHVSEHSSKSETLSTASEESLEAPHVAQIPEIKRLLLEVRELKAVIERDIPSEDQWVPLFFISTVLQQCAVSSHKDFTKFLTYVEATGLPLRPSTMREVFTVVTGLQPIPEDSSGRSPPGSRDSDGKPTAKKHKHEPLGITDMTRCMHTTAVLCARSLKRSKERVAWKAMRNMLNKALEAAMKRRASGSASVHSTAERVTEEQSIESIIHEYKRQQRLQAERESIIVQRRGPEALQRSEAAQMRKELEAAKAMLQETQTHNARLQEALQEADEAQAKLRTQLQRSSDDAAVDKQRLLDSMKQERQRERAAYEHEIRVLTEEVEILREDLNTKLAASKSSDAAAEEERDALQQQLMEVREHYKALMERKDADIADERFTAKTLRQELLALRRECEDLQRSSETAATAQRRIDELSDQLTIARRRIVVAQEEEAAREAAAAAAMQRKEAELSALRTEYATVHEERRALLAQCEELEAELADARAEADALESKYAALKEERDALQREATALEAQRNGTESEAAAQVKRLHAQLHALTTELRETKETLSSVRKEVVVLEDKHEQSRRAHAAAQEEVAQLQQRLREAETAAAEAAQAQTQLQEELRDVQSSQQEAKAAAATLQQRIVTVEAAKKLANTELTRAQRQAHEAQRGKEEAEAEVSALQQRVRGLEDAKAEIDLEVSQLQQRLQAMEAGKKEAEDKSAALHGRVQETEKAKKEAEKEVSQLQQRVSDYEQSSKEADTSLSRLQQRLRDADVAKKEAEKELSQLNKRLSDAEKASKEAEEQKSQLQQRLRKTEKTSKEAEKELSQLQQHVRDAHAGKKEAVTEAQRLKKRVYDCEQSKKEAEKEMSQLQRRLHEAEMAKKEAEKEVSQLQQRVSDYEQSSKEADTTLSRLQQSLRDAAAAKKEAEKELSQLKERLEGLEAENARLKRDLYAAVDAKEMAGRRESAAALGQAKKEASRLRNDKQQLQRALESAQKQQTNAEATASAAERKLTELQDKLKAEGRKKEELMKEMQELTARLRFLEAEEAKQSTKQKKQKDKAYMALAKEKDTVAAELAALRQEHLTTASSHKKAQQQLTAAEKKRKLAETERDKLNRELRDLRQQTNVQQTQRKDAAAGRGDTNEVAQQAAAAAAAARKQPPAVSARLTLALLLLACACLLCGVYLPLAAPVIASTAHAALPHGLRAWVRPPVTAFELRHCLRNATYELPTHVAQPHACGTARQWLAALTAADAATSASANVVGINAVSVSRAAPAWEQQLGGLLMRQGCTECRDCSAAERRVTELEESINAMAAEVEEGGNGLSECSSALTAAEAEVAQSRDAASACEEAKAQTAADAAEAQAAAAACKEAGAAAALEAEGRAKEAQGALEECRDARDSAATAAEAAQLRARQAVAECEATAEQLHTQLSAQEAALQRCQEELQAQEPAADSATLSTVSAALHGTEELLHECRAALQRAQHTAADLLLQKEAHFCPLSVNETMVLREVFSTTELEETYIRELVSRRGGFSLFDITVGDLTSFDLGDDQCFCRLRYTDQQGEDIHLAVRDDKRLAKLMMMDFPSNYRDSLLKQQQYLNAACTVQVQRLREIVRAYALEHEFCSHEGGCTSR